MAVCDYIRISGLTSNGVGDFIGVKSSPHHSEKPFFISPRTKQDYHSLATRGCLIIITIGELPRI